MSIDGDSVHGAKTRAGILLSKYIRTIALEETELVLDPSEGDRMATKAEALARQIWKRALGYSEYRKEIVGDKEIEREYVVNPNIAYVKLVYDRLEGKVGDSDSKNDVKPTIADKVTKQGADRINDIGSLINS